MKTALARAWEIAPQADKIEVELTLSQKRPVIVPDSNGADAAAATVNPVLELWIKVEQDGKRIYGRADDHSPDVDATLLDLKNDMPAPLSPEQREHKAKIARLRAEAEELEQSLKTK